jgi:GT2 family glycosyltransferase
MKTGETMTDLSVIICTFNRARLLKRALRALSRQSLASELFEVVVVDDCSSDDTHDVCNAMVRELPGLRYVSTEENGGPSRARNIGVRAARGDYILFTDDDCVAEPRWVERMRDALGRCEIASGAVASPTESYLKLCHNIAEFHHFMPGQREGQREGPREFIATANMGIRRSAFEELEGFEEEMNLASDMELILRARSRGYEVHFVPDAVVTHDPDRATLSSIFGYSARHASKTILLRNEYRSLLRTPFVLRSPLLVLAASPLIALRVTLAIYLSNSRLAKLLPTAPVVYALKLAWCWGASRGLRSMALTRQHV